MAVVAPRARQSIKNQVAVAFEGAWVHGEAVPSLDEDGRAARRLERGAQGRDDHLAVAPLARTVGGLGPEEGADLARGEAGTAPVHEEREELLRLRPTKHDGLTGNGYLKAPERPHAKERGERCRDGLLDG